MLGIAVLGGLPQEGEEGGSIAGPVLILFGKLFAAMFICFLLERLVLNKLFSMFARSLELLYLGALGYATGLAAIGVTAGFSGEITAFLAGVSLSQLPYKMHIETKMEPIKTLGVAIFFISLGLSLELGKPMLDALPIGLFLALFTVVATMPLFCALGYAAGVKSHTAFMLGMLMNQISEFSLILCTLTVRAGVFENVVLTTMTVAAVVSRVLTPDMGIDMRERRNSHDYRNNAFIYLHRCRLLSRASAWARSIGSGSNCSAWRACGAWTLIEPRWN